MALQGLCMRSSSNNAVLKSARTTAMARVFREGLGTVKCFPTELMDHVKSSLSRNFDV